MDDLTQFIKDNLLLVIGAAGTLFAIYKDWRREKRDEAENKRNDLREDYERVKQEREDLRAQLVKEHDLRLKLEQYINHYMPRDAATNPAELPPPDLLQLPHGKKAE